MKSTIVCEFWELIERVVFFFIVGVVRRLVVILCYYFDNLGNFYK